MKNNSETHSAISADAWQNDASLRRAGELIEQSNGRIRVASFGHYR